MAGYKYRTIKLTHEDMNLLECYILMTTQHRKDAAESWRKLAEEKNEDGTPKFPTASSNAEWYEETSKRLTEILRIMMDESVWSED